MPDECLLIDIGNSRLKWIRARAGVLDAASAGQGGLEALARELSRPGPLPVDEVRIASVAGEERSRSVEEVCRAVDGVVVRRLVTRDGQGGVRCAYEDPRALGVDRWLAMVGAVARHGQPVVAWDLGTATTLDAVDADRRHVGGWILPGPDTMRTSLGARTGLPTTPPEPDPRVHEPARDTAAAIRRGVLAAQFGALDRFLAEVRDRCGSAPRIVVTGGAAGEVLGHARQRALIHDSWLVFHGMLID